MITARHARWAERLFTPYVRRLVRRHFSHYYLVNSMPTIDPAASLLVTPNHISWWDGFLAYVFFRPRLPGRRLHLMMLERELCRYSFFSRLGAFSIDPGEWSHVMETAAYVQGCLLYTSPSPRDRTRSRMPSSA